MCLVFKFGMMVTHSINLVYLPSLVLSYGVKIKITMKYYTKILLSTPNLKYLIHACISRWVNYYQTRGREFNQVWLAHHKFSQELVLGPHLQTPTQKLNHPVNVITLYQTQIPIKVNSWTLTCFVEKCETTHQLGLCCHVFPELGIYSHSCSLWT